MPQIAPPVRAPAGAARAAPPDRLVLQAGDARWAVPAPDLLCIADAREDLTPIPHAPPAVCGLARIGGRAVPVVDLAPGGRGGALAVVASGTGGVALRVDAVSRGTAPALPLADLVPWAPPPAADRPPLPRPATARTAARVPLLLVACGGTMAALPAEGIERVGTATSVQPLRSGADALVRVDDALLPARRLADALPTAATGGEGRWAVVLRGKHGVALLVDGVVGLESADPARIATVTLPDGAAQRWLDRPDADPVPVVDIAALFGRPATAIPAALASPSAPAATATRAVLTVQAEDLRLALPLDLLVRVLEPGVQVGKRPAPGAVPAFDLAVALGRRARPQAGTLILVRTAAASPCLLSADRVVALAPPPEPWQPAPPLPPAAALAFDAVCHDTGRWNYRLRHDLPVSPPAALKRALAAARLGWADPDTPV